MRILGHLDRFGPPVGGGVITTVSILRELARRGHHVCLITNRDATEQVPGIHVLEAPPTHELHSAYVWADIVVPHMSSVLLATSLAGEFDKPVIYPVYDDGQLDHYGLTPEDVALVVYCSVGLQGRMPWRGRQSVVYPPISVEEHRTEVVGDAITIPSLSPEKGGVLFWELVERLPDRKFIGLIGGWGQQIVPEQIPDHVEIIEHQGSDLRSVFRRTRVLLVPSQRLGEGDRYWTENWGRAAVEAACSGIPVISSPAPGPLEALGDAGIFCERDDLDAWINAIKDLDDPATYQWRSEVVYNRALELQEIVEQQLNTLELELQRIVWSSRSQHRVSLDDAGGDGWTS